MTWSSARARKRPRRRSVCFRSIWWLVQREAAWNIMGGARWKKRGPWSRREFSRSDTYYVRRLAEELLRYCPSRRIIR